MRKLKGLKKVRDVGRGWGRLSGELDECQASWGETMGQARITARETFKMTSKLGDGKAMRQGCQAETRNLEGELVLHRRR